MGLPIIGTIIEQAMGLVDGLHTSEEEKLQAKMGLLAIQTEFASQALEYEAAVIEARAKVIMAEASGKGLKAWWRPVTMLTFVAMMGTHWLGFTPENLSPDHVSQLLSIIQLGLGGYVVGRSAEKIVPGVVTALKSKENT